MDAPESEPAVPDTTVPTKRRTDFFYACLAAAFFLGVSVGVLASVFGMRYFLEHMQPRPEQFADDIAGRIASDFRLSQDERQAVSRILADGHHAISGEIADSFTRIGKLEEAIAARIAKVIPEGRDRERWLADYESYFPRPPRPRPGDAQMPGDDRMRPDDRMPGDLSPLPPPPGGRMPGR